MVVRALLQFLSLCWTMAAASSEDVMVRTAQGRLRGGRMTTYTGKPFFAFRGVRYGEAPVGDYRFKPPVPVRPWGEEIREALADGPVCPQPSAQYFGSSWSEDCLFLNVYSKELSSNAKQPVMVYLHAGGYASVTGNSNWEGPQYLLEKSVVLVTLNYRLGALGFVCTNDSILPGNYGMKDQVEALKWVRENILAFGGDPERVTLFGYSAGGAGVLLHMVSPLSRGLFHRAIAMSGSATSGWAVNREPSALASRLTHNLGCPSTDSRLIYACLMKHSAEEIVNATIPIKDFEFTPIALFAPAVEEGPDAFLPADPLELLQTRQFAQVPLVLGVTRNEFAYRGYNVLLNETLTEEFNDYFASVAPIEFMYERKGEKSRAISAAIRKFYLNNQPISNRTRTRFMEIYTDALITFSVVQTARLMAVRSSQPVYLYVFDYAGQYSHRPVPPGVPHHDDLIYLFYISEAFPEFNATERDAGMVRTLTTIWTNFASTGVPSVPCRSTVWQPLRKGEDGYLRISRCPEMVQGVPFPHRMAFWDSQFPLSGPRQQYY